MNIIHALILGVVEGITEFLPISSTAHLTLASSLLGLSQSDFVKTFEISIQSGAILAAIIYYSKRLISNRVLLSKVFTAFVPSALVGLVLYKFIKSFLIGNLWVTLIALFAGGLVLLVIKPKKNVSSNLSYFNAIIIGLCQSLAIIPGVSRSAATIVAGLLLGQSQAASTEFSFLLAIPTLLAAASLDLVKSVSLLSEANLPLLLVGFISSAVTAFLAIKFFVRFVASHSLRFFGVYRIALASLILILQFIHG